MQVVGYVRVSTDKQAERGMSLEAQEAKLRQYAALYELELVAIEVDAGVSAKTMTQKRQRTMRFEEACQVRRPALYRALARLQDGTAEGVLVVKLDRLTRSVQDMGELIEQYFRQWSLMSVSEQIDTRTAAGRMVLNILATVSQWERETISERTSEAMQYRKGQGLPYCKAVVTDPAVVVRIREWRAAGLSYRAIAAELNAAGITPRLGARWYPNVVRRIWLRTTPARVRRIA
jgi:site-specific DNA recombinase